MTRFHEITQEMADTYERKNADYGNSFHQLYEQYGLTSVLIRLSDKLHRLESLNQTKTQRVMDESIIDTLMDMANYAIMARMELEQADNKQGTQGGTNMKELIQQVQYWAQARGIDTGDGIKQGLYLVSEQGELADAYLKNNFAELQDAIGDMLVVMIIYATQVDEIRGLTNWLTLARKPVMMLDDMDRLLGLLAEEVGHLNVYRGHYARKEALYNIVVYLDEIASYYDTSLEECLQLAYDVIKVRKGKTVNGVFVKEVQA